MRPSATSRYSVNFDEPTLSAPTAPTVSWPPAVAVPVLAQLNVRVVLPASANCAEAGGPP